MTLTTAAPAAPPVPEQRRSPTHGKVACASPDCIRIFAKRDDGSPFCTGCVLTAHATADYHSWTAAAACLRPGAPDLDDFFPEQGQHARLHDAQAFCAGNCPLETRARCLELGISDKYGVFGGIAPTQRLKIRRQVEQNAADTPGWTPEDGVDFIHSLL